MAIAAEPVDLEYPICCHMNRTIASFCPEECDRLFRFKKAELPRLLAVLQMPDTVRTDNACRFTSEEVLLFSLCRLATPGRMEDISRAHFGRDYSQWGRAFRWFLRHVKSTFQGRMTNNLVYWEPMFASCAAKIRLKAAELGCEFNDRFNICGFIDDNCFATCSPGGPTRSGPNAARAEKALQKAFYNGWKAQHGLKWQTFDLPNGLTADIFGPRTCRANDLRLLRNSALIERLAEAQRGSDMQYMIYGDGIFPFRTHLRSRHKANRVGAVITERQALENSVMAKVRISIEWHYGNLCTLFPFLDYKRNLKIRLQPLASLYFVATFLRNCHVCLYENNTSRYFNLPPPSLESFALG